MEQLKKKVEEIKNSDSFSLHNAFVKELTENNFQEVLDFHLKLIDEYRNNKDFHRRLCKAFEKRPHNLAEKFLLEKLKEEKSQDLKGDIIQILGIMKSKGIVPVLPSLIEDKDELIRYKAIIVTGWVGDKSNLTMLNKCLQSDAKSELRGFSATAMRQIWYSGKASSEDILPFLYTALLKETSDETNAMIVIVIQDLLKRKFGLQELINDGTIKGDVKKAKEKIIKALNL